MTAFVELTIDNLDQCIICRRNSIYYHAELAISPRNSGHKTIASTHCAYLRRMARLSWPGWLQKIASRYTGTSIGTISVITWFD